MDHGVFKEKVEKGLANIHKHQISHFAWRCAFRALPFLGIKGNFNFWDINDRQKHLYAILYALDVNAAYSAGVVRGADATKAYSAAMAAYSAAKAAYSAAVDAADAAAYAAKAYSAAVDAADAACSAADAKNKSNFYSIILGELTAIINNELIDPPKIDFYGEVWGNFEKALATEGCAYWGRLYKEIIENGLIAEPEALRRRMNVPAEIRARGAAAVANYLEELEKGSTRLNEARIVILGDKGAGKTCIARRLIDPNAPMTTDDESTAGVNTSLWKLERENINVHIWDFAGHTVTHAVHQFFLSERCLYPESVSPSPALRVSPF